MRLVAYIAYVFQWGYDGKQPSIVSLGTTSRLSGNSDEVMREADANDTSGELGSAFPWSLVGESVFSTGNAY